MAAIMIQRRAPWSQPWSYWQEWLQPPTWGKAHAHEANADQHFVHTFFLACFFFNLTFGTDALLVLWAMLKIQKTLEGLMQLIPRCPGKDWKWARRWPELPAESLFSTKGAVRRPMTYDDHPIPESSKSFDLLNSIIYWSGWSIDFRWMFENRCCIHPGWSCYFINNGGHSYHQNQIISMDSELVWMTKG